MRLQTILGIRETGYDRAPWLPLDPRITLELFRSVDYVIPILVVDTQGVPVDLTGVGTLATMTIKKRPTDHAYLYSSNVTLDIGLPGQGYYTIPAATFDFALEGGYFWEVMGLFRGLRDPLIPLSPIRLMAQGTRSAC